MAYFLKKTKQQNRIYLAIYESFYSPEVKGTKHRCFRSLGNIETLKANGIADPVSFYSGEVKKAQRTKKGGTGQSQAESEADLGHFSGTFPWILSPGQHIEHP